MFCPVSSPCCQLVSTDLNMEENGALANLYVNEVPAQQAKFAVHISASDALNPKVKLEKNVSGEHAADSSPAQAANKRSEVLTMVTGNIFLPQATATGLTPTFAETRRVLEAAESDVKPGSVPNKPVKRSASRLQTDKHFPTT